jgi:hypothetical protein
MVKVRRYIMNELSMDEINRNAAAGAELNAQCAAGDFGSLKDRAGAALLSWFQMSGENATTRPRFVRDLDALDKATDVATVDRIYLEYSIAAGLPLIRKLCPSWWRRMWNGAEAIFVAERRSMLQQEQRGRPTA